MCDTIVRYKEVYGITQYNLDRVPSWQTRMPVEDLSLTSHAAQPGEVWLPKQIENKTRRIIIHRVVRESQRCAETTTTLGVARNNNVIL